jgi:thiazolinyl imide reductase
VGAKFGEMYLNAFMQPRRGWNWLACWPRKRDRELAYAFGIPLYTSPEQITEMPDIACIVVRSTVAGGTGTQLARHFLTRGVHVIQEHPSIRMTSVHYKRWRRNRAAAIGSTRFIRIRLQDAPGSAMRSGCGAAWRRRRR